MAASRCADSSAISSPSRSSAAARLQGCGDGWRMDLHGDAPSCWGDSTPRFRSHLRASRTGDCGTSHDFSVERARPRIVGPVRAAVPAAARHRQYVVTSVGRGCQAEISVGVPPARAIISSNALRHLRLEVGFDLVDLGQLGEGPAAEGAEVVDGGHPVGVHRGLLLLRVLAPVALDLDDEVQQVVVAVPVVHQHDEVGEIAADLGAVAVRHLEAEVVVLHVRLHPRVGLGHAAELGFPVAVQHHPVDVAARGIRLPAVRPGRVEADVRGRADGIVRSRAPP